MGELPLNVQAKLLRVLETGEVQRVGALQGKKVDVRIVAATNRDLQNEAAAGRFRSDLYYRLNVVELNVPPLRDRPDDMPYLTAAFVREFSSRFNKRIEGIAPTAERVLHAGDWPGNVRQLRNVLERACMLADGPVLTEREIAAAMPVRGQTRAMVSTAGPRTLADDVELLERAQIERVLQEVRGNKTAAAQRLGVSRRTLHRKLSAFRTLPSPEADAT